MAIQDVPSLNGYSAANANYKREQQGRGFAAVYEAVRKASINDNGSDTAPAQDPAALENRKYIENLHEHVDTLRGEILARVIQTAQNVANPVAVTEDITRLSVRLGKLRQKLETEEARLSGKLLNLEV